MYTQFAAVLVFGLVGIAFVIGSLLFGALIRLRQPGGQKNTVYECGEPTIGSSWIRYNSRFYNVGLIYLLFDVEVLLLIPAMLVIKDMAGTASALAAVLALMFFLTLLAIGLAYEWYWGNLDWIRSSAKQRTFKVEIK